jgi:glycosyltransferase involved in cell wall biosynthesis
MKQYSVLISVYKNDNPDHLMDSLISIRDQSLPPSQIVIVQDGPIPLALKHQIDLFIPSTNINVSFVVLEENVGLSKALNAGLKVCEYDMVLRQDADDISLKYRAEMQIDVFNTHNNLGIVSGWYEEYDYSMSILEGDRRLPENNLDIINFSKRRTPINHACSMFSKSAVEDVGGYPLIDGLCEDWWLALRMIKKNYGIYNIQKNLVNVRGGDTFYSRRSGVAYIKQEVINQYEMYQEGLISGLNCFSNILLRVPVRILPTNILKQVYKFIIRKI